MSGLIDLATSIGLVGLIWVAGVVLIKAADAVEVRHVAARHGTRGKRRHR